MQFEVYTDTQLLCFVNKLSWSSSLEKQKVSWHFFFLQNRTMVSEDMILVWKKILLPSPGTEPIIFNILCGHVGSYVKETSLIWALGTACNLSFHMCNARWSRDRRILSKPITHIAWMKSNSHSPTSISSVSASCNSDSKKNIKQFTVTAFRRRTWKQVKKLALNLYLCRKWPVWSKSC